MICSDEAVALRDAAVDRTVRRLVPAAGAWPMSDLQIQSVGAPHALHADRIVANMLRQLAEENAVLWALVHGITRDPFARDGNPRAQAKLEAKVRAAGADYTILETGKRGRYRLSVYAFTGWDPIRDQRITVDDEPPEKPWLTYWSYMVEGVGRGGLKLYSRGVLYLTHHSLSRVTQRWQVRTLSDLRKVIHTIALCVLNYTNDLDEHGTWDHIFNQRNEVITPGVAYTTRPRSRALMVMVGTATCPSVARPRE
jgi:hypothetical protein